MPHFNKGELQVAKKTVIIHPVGSKINRIPAGVDTGHMKQCVEEAERGTAGLFYSSSLDLPLPPLSHSSANLQPE